MSAVEVPPPQTEAPVAPELKIEDSKFGVKVTLFEPPKDEEEAVKLVDDDDEKDVSSGSDDDEEDEDDDDVSGMDEPDEELPVAKKSKKA